MNINNSNALNVEKPVKYKAKGKIVDESRSLWFMVVTLVLGWLGVLIIMMNGGHGYL